VFYKYSTVAQRRCGIYIHENILPIKTCLACRMVGYTKETASGWKKFEPILTAEAGS